MQSKNTSTSCLEFLKEARELHFYNGSNARPYLISVKRDDIDEVVRS